MSRPCENDHDLRPDYLGKNGGCHVCWLWENHADYREKMGGPPLTTKVGCRHFSKEIGRELCPTCRGHVEVKLFSCGIHGRCTLSKPLSNIACCNGCEDGPIVVHANANGIGDALLGLCAVAGLKTAKPHREVIYRVSQLWQEDWCGLFSGYDRLTRLPTQTLTGVERRLHDSAAEKQDTQFRTPRWEHYRNAIASPCVVVPPAKPLPPEAVEWAKQYHNFVVLSPFSVWVDRAWQPEKWLELERRLLATGQRCVIMDGLTSTQDVQRTDPFHSTVLRDEPAARVAAVLNEASLFVGNDSGMCHAAGMLHRPALCLSWFHNGNQLYGLYGSVETIHAGLIRAGGWRDDITVDMVSAKVWEMLGRSNNSVSIVP